MLQPEHFNFRAVSTKQISGHTKKQGFFWSRKGTSLKAPMFWELSAYPDVTVTKTIQFGQHMSAWSCNQVCNQGTTWSLSQTLYIPAILEKWQHIPAELLTITPYCRHVLDPCLNSDLLLYSLSVSLHFLTLVSVTFLIWQLSFWHLGP